MSSFRMLKDKNDTWMEIFIHMLFLSWERGEADFFYLLQVIQAFEEFIGDIEIGFFLIYLPVQNPW